MQDVEFLWLEITGRCQLACIHCYASSGPSGTHGTMAIPDWLRVLDEAAGLGVRMVQFIGGEPTLHPGLPVLLDGALARGLDVEVFSNLVHVTPDLWELFSRPGVRLATSYYSDDSGEHTRIVGRPGARRATCAHIAEARRRGIPLRVGVIDLGGGQRSNQAVDELIAMGVTSIGVDHLRQIGRGVRDRVPDLDQLCGRCGAGVAAVSADGDVWPCVFARWLPVGNVLPTSLAAALRSEAAERVWATLHAEFETRWESPRKCQPDKPCRPDSNEPCRPDSRPCDPATRNCPPNRGQCPPARSGCRPNCPPGYHSGEKCWPDYYE